MDHVYSVVVRHNVVVALERTENGLSQPVAQTKLEVGTQLADNYRAHGCIDGEYLFETAQRARVFAILCLEFTRALVDKRLETLKTVDLTGGYHAPEFVEG